MTTVITTKDKNITVEMNVFDDLNLKDLLDSVSKIQGNYDSAVNQRLTLINEKDANLKNAEAKREQDIFVIKSMKLPAKEEKSRISDIEEEYNLSLQTIQSNYEAKMTVIEASIKEYEAQLAEYDSTKVQAAQEQERLLNSERRVQELERRKLTQQYESQIADLEKTIEELRSENSESVFKSVSSVSSKYQKEIDGLDPKISDKKADFIVSDFRNNKFLDFSSEAAIASSSDAIVTSAFEDYQTAYDNYIYLYSIISSIPQKNTIPLFVATSKNLVNKMGETFSQATLALEEDKLSLTGQVNNLEAEVDNLETDVDKLTDDYNSLTDEYNLLSDQYSKMEEQYKLEIEEAQAKFEEEKVLLQKDLEEQTQLQKAQKLAFENCLSGIITSAKAQAAVISAAEKDDIRIFVLPEVAATIPATGANAEIKAGKSIKGSIVKASDEYFKFIPAKDKNGNTIDFDFSTVKQGLIVKLSIKK